MLYYLFSSNNDSKSIIEHSDFNDSESFKTMLEECKLLANKFGYSDIEKYFEYDLNIIDKIKSNLPMIASIHESKDNINDTNYGIEPIPHDVYHNSIFSWVSTSLIDKDNQVFINYSTFNPILYYHPLIIHGNKHHIKSLKKSDYLSFSNLVNEEYDDNHNILERFVMNVNEINNLLQLSKDELIERIIENRDVLEYNRKNLFQCNSIENILCNFYNILNE